MKKIYIACIALLLSACQNTPNTPIVEKETPADSVLKDSVSIQPQPTDSVKTDSVTVAKATSAKSEAAIHGKRSSELTNRFTVSKQFSGAVNDTLSLDGAQLCVPAEGMKAGMKLSITPLDSASLPSVPAGLANVTAKGGGYRFLPHGEHFKRFAKVVIPYDSVRIPKGYTAKDIRTYYYDEESKKWTVLPKDSILKDQQLASALTTHFTDMINGIITVPETPEAQGYAPTALTDIKAADPSVGKLAVQAPKPNNNGTANIQIPFNFPKGRAGMGPNISVGYSNEGGSGWCGYGWGVNTPSISLDTRWGVPQYDAKIETESYLFNGEQFTDRAYRDIAMKRTADKRFYLRRETDFAEIVRKGDSPTNYKWEVKKYDGTVDLYEALETDEKGNIAKWGLKKTTDAHGNCVTYEYETVNGIAYIRSINYTGFENEAGAYTIKINRKGGRVDQTSNGRNGFLQTDDQQLTSIDVLLKDEVFRSYKFEYTEGRFSKTLLAAVAETDGKGNELYRNAFIYHDAIKDGGLFEAEAVGFKPSKSFIKRAFETVVDGFEGSESLISGATSSGYSINAGANVGVEFLKKGGKVYGGGSYTYTKNESDGDITLADMDGDGLTDIVYREELVPGFSKVYYRKNLYATTGKIEFAEKREVDGINGFSNNISEGHSSGEEAGAQFAGKFASVGASATQSKSDSRTRVYFQDFNGDGLVDLVNKGTVYFSHIDDGKVVFEKHSGNTPNPIPGTGVEVANTLIGDTTGERARLESESPLLDVVRMWKAPFAGKVSLKSTVKVNENSKDGIDYVLQVDYKNIERGRLLANQSAEVNGQFEVKRGSYLLFRLQSHYSGSFDDVEWAPEIAYDTMYNVLWTDNENNFDLIHYSAEKDFQPGEIASDIVYGPSKVSIKAPYKKEWMSEDAVLKCMRNGKVIYTDTLKAARTYDDEFTYNETIAKADTAIFTFVVETKTEVDHAKLSWLPVVNKLNTENNVTLENYIIPSRSSYNNIAFLALPVKLDLDTTDTYTYKDSTVRVEYITHVNSSSSDWAMKYADGGVVPADSFTVPSLQGKKVYVSAYFHQEVEDYNIKFDSTYLAFHRIRLDSVFNEVDSVWEKVEVDTIVSKVLASVYSVFDNGNYGPLYKGWGQFAVKGDEPDAPIVIAKIHSANSQYSNKNEDIDEDNLDNFDIKQLDLTPNEDRYILNMSYDAKNKRYVAEAANCYINATGGSPSRKGSQEIVVDVPMFEGATSAVAAPYIRSHTETDSYNVSSGVKAGGFGLGGNFSYSKTVTVSNSGVMDFNGDRYPDWYEGDDHAYTPRYTMANGGISKKASSQISLGLNEELSEGKSVGASIGNAPKGKASSSTSSSPSDRSKPYKWGRVTSDAEASNKASEDGAISFNASGNFSKSDGFAERGWYDMNGDGLPDLLYKGGDVRYNTGYGFAAKKHIDDINNFSKNSSSSGGAGLSFSKDVCGSANIGTGFNYTNSHNYTNLQMADLNGDGLPDIVDYDDGLTFRYNKGTSFAEKIEIGGIHANKGKSICKGGHINVGGSIPVFTWFGVVTISVTPYANVSNNVSISKTNATLTDMNGDGLPDLVVSDSDEDMQVYFNRTGRTNMLDSVVMAGGARIALEYERTKNTYNMPHNKYVLSAVEVIGGNKENGATRIRNTFTYEGGVYDRYEREFLGFKKVTTKQLDTEDGDAVYRSNELTYSNRRLIEKGLLLADTTFSATGDLLSVSNNTYEYKANNGSEFIALVKTQKESFTGGNAIEVTEDYVYDEIGNVIGYTSTAGDVVDVKVQYNTNGNLRRIPVKVNVSGGASRERSCSVNDKGDITKIVMNNGDKPAIFDFEHDKYGNIVKVTRPQNEKGQRMWNKYAYDDVAHAFVTEISNAFGYKASTTYDYRFGAKTSTTDINNNVIKYAYDDFGRMTKVVGPYDDDYTIKMAYEGVNATTYNHTLEGDIVTITTADNLLRPVKVKKTSVINGSLGYVVSGVTVLDAFGRVVKEYLPAEEGQASTYYSSTAYDDQDRKLKITLPDGTSTQMSYEVENNGLKTTITDAEGHISEQYADARERTTKTVRKGSPEDIVVTYDFNPLGELLTVTHPNGLQTKYTYDQLGNKLTVDNPDAGLTTYTYDAVGNVVTKTTPNLAKISQGGYIKYDYDYERLSEVKYPKNIVNRVQFTYGKAGDDFNRAGRLVLVQDASGGVERFYGKLGEEIKTIRTVLLNSADVRTYVSETEYDSWNRVRKMVYPDGEVVTYGYDKAGQLNRMSSEKDGFNYDFIKDMTYDVYGNIASKTYGNGTTSNYTYDPKRQHLSNMTVSNKAGEFINAKYSYDNIDNILGIENSAKPFSTIGGTSKHSYKYDDFSRLISAEGGCKDNTVSYNLKMEYDVMSNPIRKNQTISGSTIATSHDLKYLYEGEKPDAASQIGEDHYSYDDNGNPVLIYNDSTTRTMVWDEENRMVMLNDNGYASRYTYDYTGTRVIKSHGPLEGVYINGAEQGLDYHDADNYTLYVSPYLIVNNERFTKHYYAGTQRIASKVGSGDFYNVYGVNGFHLTAGQMDYQQRLEQMEQGIQAYYLQNGIPPGVPTQKGSNADPYITGVALPNVPLGNYSVPSNWPTNVKFNEPGDVPGPPVQFEEEDLSDVSAGFGFESDHTYEGDWFFFHTDHLGSTAYLTDTAGNVSQFVCYTPYGEAIVDEHLTTYENPFKFSGKELDAITGLYDHGARSRNPISTLWYGIDPLWEEFPEMSPYAYCHANPIRLIDPDGRADEESLWEKLPQFAKELLEPHIEVFRSLLQEGYSSDEIAIGMEYSGDVSASIAKNYGIEVEGSLTAGFVMFLGGEDAFYAYSYFGSEKGGGICVQDGTSLDFEAGVTKSLFFAVNQTRTRNHTTFDGDYKYLRASAELDLKPFVKLPLNASLGLSSAVGDDWTVYSFERSISIGGSFGKSTFSVSGTTGFGSCKIIQDIGPKTDGQKIVSWLPWIAIELSKPY